MSHQEFLEYVRHDLKHIVADLKGFLEVYYPMLKATHHPQNEHDFILGWMVGSKEQEYSTAFYNKYNERIYHELLFEIQREIAGQKKELADAISEHLDKTA